MAQLVIDLFTGEVLPIDDQEYVNFNTSVNDKNIINIPDHNGNIRQFIVPNPSAIANT